MAMERRTQPSRGARLAGEEKTRAVFSQDNPLGEAGAQQKDADYSYQENVATTRKDITLSPPQIIALRWLLFMRSVASGVADDMGLGKTYTSCFFAAQLYLTRGHNVVVAVPKSTQPDWIASFRSAGVDIKVLAAQQAMRQLTLPGIFLLTHNVLQRSLSNSRFKAMFHKCTLILDEAQVAKNGKGSLFQALKANRTDDNCYYLVTGTPYQNNISELYSMFVLSARIDASYPDMQHFQMLMAEATSGVSWGGLSRDARDLFVHLCGFIMIRVKEVTANKASGVPPMHTKVVRVGLTELQQRRYRRFLAFGLPTVCEGEATPLWLRCSVDGLNVGRDTDAVAVDARALPNPRRAKHDLSYRRQLSLSCWPSRAAVPLVKEGVALDVGQQGHAGGLSAVAFGLLDQIYACEEKCVVFCQFYDEIEMFLAFCHQRKRVCRVVSGSTKIKERERIIAHFNVTEIPEILLVSTRAGAAGINLQGANISIVFNSDYNPQQDMQAEARTYRTGQRRETFVVYLVPDSQEGEEKRMLALNKTREWAAIFGFLLEAQHVALRCRDRELGDEFTQTAIVALDSTRDVLESRAARFASQPQDVSPSDREAVAAVLGDYTAYVTEPSASMRTAQQVAPHFMQKFVQVEHSAMKSKGKRYTQGWDVLQYFSAPPKTIPPL